MKTDKLLSETISYLRFPLIVGVVFIHFNLLEKGFSANGIIYDLKGDDIFWGIRYVVRLFSDVLPSVSVPLFFMISGYLFFNVDLFDRETYLKKSEKGLSL